MWRLKDAVDYLVLSNEGREDREFAEMQNKQSVFCYWLIFEVS